MKSRIIRPRGGLRSRGGGLIRPGGGFVDVPYPSATGPALLADFDFSAPVASSDFSSPNATDEWLLQETSGAYANNVGSDSLSAFNGGAQGQDAPGNWNGSSYTAKKAFELLTTTDYVRAATSSALDSDDEDLCVTIEFRMKGQPTGNGRVVSKRQASGSNGWNIYVATNGRLGVTLDGATGTATPTLLADDLSDGATYWFKFFYDFSASEVKHKSALNSEVVASTVGLGTLTNSGLLTLGDDGVFGGGADGVQILSVSGAVGATAAAMYDETVVLPGADPTGLLTTQSRASLISVPVAADAVCHFAPNTLPIGFNANFSDTNKLGLYCNSAVTNLITESEDYGTGWSLINATRAAAQGDAPDGFRSAYSLTATANNGQIWLQHAVASATEYTESVWVMRNGGSDVDGKLRIYDNTSGTFTDQAFTAGDTWQRIPVSKVSDGAGVFMRQYIFIDTSGESILIWGSQGELGDGASAYIRTSGASASLVAADYKYDSMPYYPTKGEIQLAFVPVRDIGVTGHIFTLGTTGADRRQLSRPASLNANFTVSDDAGAGEDLISVSGILTNDTEQVARLLWDSGDGVEGAYESAVVFNGTTANGAAAPWEGTATAGLATTDWSPMKAISAASYTDGFLRYFRVYDDQVEALP